MAPTLRLVQERPSVENTIRNEEFVNSAPDQFALLDDDKFVLHAGGYYKMRFLQSHQVKTDLKTDNNVALYVLNTYILVWFTEGRGLEIPYQCIILHAVQGDNLYMQIESNNLISNEADGYVECILEPVDGHCKDDTLLEPTYSAAELFNAMSICSAMHLDEENQEHDDDELDSGFNFDGEWYTGQGRTNNNENNNINNSNNPISETKVPDSWLNSGTADDLDGMDIQEGAPGGMNVNIGQGPVAGTVRKREDDQDVNYKRVAK